MNHSPYSEIQTGTLLVASPEIDDEIYRRSVILLCEHTGTAGSFGLMVNKTLTIDFPQDSLQIENLNHQKIDILCGGKMQPNQMMILHSSKKAHDQIINITSEVYLGGDIQFLQDALVDDSCEKIYLCFGYVGWLASELQREFMDGKWYVYPGSRELIFDIPHEELWTTILQRMGGKYAALSSIPEDPSLN